MQRIVILGPPGAGKSTLATRLGAALNLEVIHLDRHFWQPGWVATPREEWIRIQDSLVAGPAWVIDGNYDSTLHIRAEAADTIIYIEDNALRCCIRVLARCWKHRGQPRPDLNEGCAERFNWEVAPFAWYVLMFNRRNRQHILRCIDDHRDGRRILMLQGRNGVDEFVASLPVSGERCLGQTDEV